MSLTSEKLQDIEAQINIVKEEKRRGKLYYFFNRISCPVRWNCTTNEWLEMLEFLKKQENERLHFENKLKEKYGGKSK